MLKVVLLCAGGASTGMLAKKMEEVGQQVKLDCQVSAYGVAQAATVGQEADVIMLGPQVGYQLKDVQKQVPDKPVVVIDMLDYGRMNAKKILSQAVKTYKEAKK